MAEGEQNSRLSYPKTIAVAIGVFLAAWIVFNQIGLGRAILGVSERGATGFAFVFSGIVEGVLTSLALGFVLGTAWYLARR